MSTIEKALGTLAGKDDKEAQHTAALERAGRDALPDGQGRVAHRGAGKPDVVVPLDTLHASGYLTPATPRAAIAEEFRGIKRPILRNINGQSPTLIPNANLVMVTSALEGDGKTFNSINLAISIAMEQDKTVLFVDADVLKATAGRRLGVPDNSPGLIDLLKRDDLSPRDVILRTSLDKLRILPAGSADEHSTELLASVTMHELMLELSERYSDRVIVFDSPPLLLTTEAGVLASFMGQIVFVAAANVTPQHAVREALEHLGEDKAVGMLLNRYPRRRFSLFGRRYGYGFGYGYGYGYGAREQADREQLP